MFLNLLGVLIAFILILILIRKKVNFALALIIGSLLVGIFSLQIITPLQILEGFIEATIYNFTTHQFVPDTIELAILMTLILMLAKCMQETKAITRLIDSLRTFFTKGGTIGLIPAVYGLMPIPGGALFSAPLIDQEGTTYGLSNDQKNVLNVWFRHLWFPIFPLSQVMILITSKYYSDIPIQNLILADVPFFIVYLLVGYIYMRRYMHAPTTPATLQKKNYSGLKFLIPPIIPLPFYALTLIGLNETNSFIIGVIVGIILLFVLTKTDLKTSLRTLRKSFSWNLALAIFAIMIFRQMIQLSQVDTFITQGMQTLGIPALAIILLLPLIIALLIGSDFASVALSYPLVAPLIAISGVSILGCTTLIFLAVLIGYLISPIHLCNVLSSEYLHTDVTRMYKMYIPASIAVLAFQLAFVILFFH
jgi:uncharacterized protein